MATRRSGAGVSDSKRGAACAGHIVEYGPREGIGPGRLPGEAGGLGPSGRGAVSR